ALRNSRRGARGRVVAVRAGSRPPRAVRPTARPHLDRARSPWLSWSRRGRATRRCWCHPALAWGSALRPLIRAAVGMNAGWRDQVPFAVALDVEAWRWALPGDLEFCRTGEVVVLPCLLRPRDRSHGLGQRPVLRGQAAERLGPAMSGVDVQDQDTDRWRDPDVRVRARDEPAPCDRHVGRRALEPVRCKPAERVLRLRVECENGPAARDQHLGCLNDLPRPNRRRTNPLPARHPPPPPRRAPPPPLRFGLPVPPP